MRCPKSRFPIRIIVFDELELIIFVSQGLTLSSASLVTFLYQVFYLSLGSDPHMYFLQSFLSLASCLASLVWLSNVRLVLMSKQEYQEIYLSPSVSVLFSFSHILMSLKKFVERLTSHHMSRETQQIINKLWLQDPLQGMKYIGLCMTS